MLHSFHLRARLSPICPEFSADRHSSCSQRNPAPAAMATILHIMRWLRLLSRIWQMVRNNTLALRADAVRNTHARRFFTANILLGARETSKPRGQRWTCCLGYRTKWNECMSCEICAQLCTRISDLMWDLGSYRLVFYMPMPLEDGNDYGLARPFNRTMQIRCTPVKNVAVAC